MHRFIRLLTALVFAAFSSGANEPVSWSDARQRGALVFDGSGADLGIRDAAPELRFTLAPGSTAGIWFRDFPASTRAYDAVAGRLQLEIPVRSGLVPATIELKGAGGYQSANIRLRPGPNKLRLMIESDRIGALEEVVVLLRHPGGEETLAGRVRLDGRLVDLASWRIALMHPLNSLFALLVLSTILGLILPRLDALRRRPVAVDLARGWAGLLVLVSAGVVHAPLMSTAGGPGLWRLLAAAAGGVAAALILWSSSTRRIAARDVALHTFLPGLLLLAAESIPVASVPARWSDVLRLNGTAASLLVLLYHLIHAYCSGTRRTGIPLAAAVSIVLLPFMAGGVLALANPALMSSLSFGGPIWIGRAWMILLVNLYAAIACGAMAGRTGFGGWTGFKWIFGTSLLVAVSPHLADAGSAPGAVTGVPAPVLAWLGAMFSQAALWAEVHLITGLLLDSMQRKPPTSRSIHQSVTAGFRRALVFAGIFMGLIQLAHLWPANASIVWLIPVIAVAMPIAKSIVESFDGSAPFFRRLALHASDPFLYLRGLVGGYCLLLAIRQGCSGWETGARAAAGFLAGSLIYAGVSLLRDAAYQWAGTGRVHGIRRYACEILLGGIAGAALGFYFDAAQLALVSAKLNAYAAFGVEPRAYEVYPLFSKWGFLNLGTYAGGTRLFFNEALAGVLTWGLAAWLFAINRSVLVACLDRDATPLRRMFSRDGLAELGSGTLYVLRWGLWMAPIIFTFLRPTGTPEWYNQDGAIRTLIASLQALRLDEPSFELWSRGVFLWILASDPFRLLIWLDHMGLRVATLVNLSFIGMDRLDARLARFAGPVDATARIIPVAVKRMATWAPLILPFYLPSGAAWDVVWSQSEVIQRTSRSVTEVFWSFDPAGRNLLAFLALAGFFSLARGMRYRRARARLLVPPPEQLSNRVYQLQLFPTGELRGVYQPKGYDLTRRAYDPRMPAGRALFVADDNGEQWPLLGNLAGSAAQGGVFSDRDALWLEQVRNGLAVRLRITLPVADQPVEQWSVTIENRGDEPRSLRVVPYLEWNLNTSSADRAHTQYNRLFTEVSYEPASNAVLARHRLTKWVGFLASDSAPDGQLTHRVEFIGRAGTLAHPFALHGGCFRAPDEEKAHPAFDGIASLCIPVSIPPRGRVTVRFLLGGADSLSGARVQIHRCFPELSGVPGREAGPVHIGHGQRPDGSTEPYFRSEDEGRLLRILTPFTPRPWDHTLANARGHVVSVTNRGLHTSASVNSQQNRLTPDLSDTTTREVPSEAFYLYDEEHRTWLSPAFEPIRDPAARYETEFHQQGLAVFRMWKGVIETELRVFVPPDEPAGVYRLTIRNHGETPLRLRVAPYFHLCLADVPEHAGGLQADAHGPMHTIYFRNPRNTFHRGEGFAAVSPAPAARTTDRDHFFGEGVSVCTPAWVEDPRIAHPSRPGAPIAAFVVPLVVPPRDQRDLVVVLGQASSREEADAVIARLCSISGAESAEAATRADWNRLLSVARLESNRPGFDALVPWLAYQAIAERLRARRGFYQASGALGYRDQLQDAVNLIWIDPALARRQILLHAAQQFEEGDAVHWFFLQADGRTGFACRSHAYDNLLWLGWAVTDYVRMTGDETVLDERVSYLRADQPFLPLPAGKHGMGFHPHRSPREEPVFDHVLRAVDLVLDRRMGVHGLPLIGSGDWNDGLDEIGSEGRGESVWLGFFLHYILERLLPLIEKRRGVDAAETYRAHVDALRSVIETTWRGDRYLRAIHDDGTEIGIKGSGVWEIDALTAAWAVLSGIQPARARRVFDTALRTLERGPVILLGWPALRTDSVPYLGRSSVYPEGVRENGMYSHGVQWLVGAARELAERSQAAGDDAAAAHYRAVAWRLWHTISPLAHTSPEAIERYGGAPNKQAADYLTTHEPGRMIWNGYTGAAAWMFRQAFEGVAGARLRDGQLVRPEDVGYPRGDLEIRDIIRNTPSDKGVSS